MKWTLLAAGIYTLLLFSFAERQVRAGIERLFSADILRMDGEALLKHPSLQSPYTNPI